MDFSPLPFGAKLEEKIVEPRSPPSPPQAVGEFRDEGEPHAEEEAVVMNPKVGKSGAGIRYRECMRNHAASIGGHASDGCGEFMAGDGKDDSLSCAACGCHRNFHRREIPGGERVRHSRGRHRVVHSPPAPSMLVYSAGGPRWDPKLVLPPVAAPAPLQAHVSSSHHHHVMQQQRKSGAVDEAEEDGRSETPEREEVGSAMRSGKKRFRTKFTAEQKERMKEYAERAGWRIQRHDDAALSEFCAEVGVKRNVLKVWMHNNKAPALRRREAPAPPSLTPPPAAVPPTQHAGL